MTGHRWLSLRMPAVAVAECCGPEIAGNRVLGHYNSPAHCFWDDSAHGRSGDLPRPLLWKRSSYYPVGTLGELIFSFGYIFVRYLLP
jgi:hypothetical protein